MRRNGRALDVAANPAGVVLAQLKYSLLLDVTPKSQLSLPLEFAEPAKYI